MTKFYCVTRGRQTGIFTTWEECKAQVNGYKGANYKSFGSEDEARDYMLAFENQNNKSVVNKDAETKSFRTDEELASLKTQAYEHLSFLKDNNLILDNTYDMALRQIDTNIRLEKERREYALVSKSSGDQSVLKNHVDVYVDGSYNKATNMYGCGVYMDDGHNKRILTKQGNCMYSGNNVEGEVAAATLALDYLKDKHYDSISLYYDYEGLGSWADNRWSANEGYTKEYKAFVANCRENNNMKIDFIHVKGHSKVFGNECVDRLAKIACAVDLDYSKEDKDIIDAIYNVEGFPSEGLSIRSQLNTKYDKQSDDDYDFNK